MSEITKENIMKIKCHRYFDENKLNNEIYNKTLILMENAYCYKVNETLLLMENTTYKYTITTQFNPTQVKFNKSMLNALKTDKNYTFTAFHNHPEDSSFSLGDINIMLEYEKIVLLVLCTNSCKYSAAILKTNKCNKKLLKILHNLIKTTFKLKLLNINSTGEPLIKWLSKHGFIYVYYINY